MLNLYDIMWAAEECERQHSGELSVYYMCNALEFARRETFTLSLESVKRLGQKVEPFKNEKGFRRVPVHFKDLSLAIRAENIDSALSNLIQYGTDLTPTEWYKTFQKVHPFIDGNGRVGSILFNLKNGTLKEPITPPNVF